MGVSRPQQQAFTSAKELWTRSLRKGSTPSSSLSTSELVDPRTLNPNPKPYALNQKPKTPPKTRNQNSKNQKTLNPQPQTLNPLPGTFKPMSAADASDHSMHSERIIVSRDALIALQKASSGGGEIVPIGTTAVRDCHCHGSICYLFSDHAQYHVMRINRRGFHK